MQDEWISSSGPDGVDLVAAGDLLASDDEWEPPTPKLLVRLFGAPRLEPAPAELRRLERMVVVYVAVGGEASPSKVRGAVWHGRAVSDSRFTNVIGNMRAALGAEIVPGRPARDRTRQDGVAPLRLLHTTTDLDVFRAMVARSRDAAVVGGVADAARGAGVGDR